MTLPRAGSSPSTARRTGLLRRWLCHVATRCPASADARSPSSRSYGNPEALAKGAVFRKPLFSACSECQVEDGHPNFTFLLYAVHVKLGFRVHLPNLDRRHAERQVAAFQAEQRAEIVPARGAPPARMAGAGAIGSWAESHRLRAALRSAAAAPRLARRWVPCPARSRAGACTLWLQEPRRWSGWPRPFRPRA